MKAPFFPVGYDAVKSHIVTRPISRPQETVMAFHPTGGFTHLSISDFEEAEKTSGLVSFHNHGTFPSKECLVVKMYRSNHPEQTISYRFEERPTGKVFVFLTDHEVTASFPSDLIRHVKGANLLIEDAQYLEETYQLATAGFGHGTGPYCVRLAKAAGGVVALGLTHHDPNATDQDVESVLSEALEEAEPDFIAAGGIDLSKDPQEEKERLRQFFPITIFSCSDYQQLSV